MRSIEFATAPKSVSKTSTETRGRSSQNCANKLRQSVLLDLRVGNRKLFRRLLAIPTIGRGNKAVPLFRYGYEQRQLATCLVIRLQPNFLTASPRGCGIAARGRSNPKVFSRINRNAFRS